MRSGVMRAAAGFAVVGVMVCALGACVSGRSDSNDSHATVGASTLSGTWEMDLSPAQDKSYMKDLVITADEPRATAMTFTGSVYGGSAFDNGLVHTSTRGDCAFAFVSDEKGQMGGPYYWVGTWDVISDGMHGRVRSLTRSFEMTWSATRKQ
jgi:hypothetical protein